MADNRRHIASKKGVLTDKELEEVKELSRICNEYGGLNPPLNIEMACSLQDSGSDRFLCYENSRLTGFLNLQPAAGQPEAHAMVHPQHRRRHVGYALLRAAEEECRLRSAISCLLVCERKSASGKAFVASVGAQYHHSEYKMSLKVGAVSRPEPKNATPKLRPADVDDVGTLSNLIATSFGTQYDETQQTIARDMLRPNRRFYIARSCGELIGGLGIISSGDRAYIVALAVPPDVRRRGYGRQILRQALKLLAGENMRNVLVEVATDNQGALALYRSQGFEVATIYDYHTLAL